jgi:two-component system CheB/CheR fusion protein
MANKTPAKRESNSEPQEKSTPKAKPTEQEPAADQPKEKKDFLIVGMGASAGGVKPILYFFATMPPNSGMAFVVILHLSPEHESNLREIIQAQTTMPVTLVNETKKVEPNCVYVIPPNRQLEMVDGVVRSTVPVADRGSRVAIDVFFRTLADVYRRNAICIVLSGTGSDGTLGLKAIKEANGFAIVQDPQEAEYDSMPRSAIATQLSDWVLPVREMPERLINFRDSSERMHLTQDDDGKVAKEIQADESLREILTVLRVRTGHDFSNYKTPTLVRRIARHLQIHDLEDIPAYLEFLREKPEEIHSLLKNLLINVTNFFRDKEAWSALEHQVIPNLFAGKKAGDTVRVWSCGCASGEEAYSLAMLLSEYASRLSDPPKIQIFATDVDDDAIAEAREHRYPQTIEADVSPDRLRRFFVKEGRYYCIKKELRETVLFAPHNVLRDPPFSKLDLITCRNLLIYLNRETQERVMEIFHFALAPRGYLFLGSSETAESTPKLFATVDKKFRIYSRRPTSISQQMVPPRMPVIGRWEVKLPEFKARPKDRAFTLGEVHYKLLEKLAPPSVLVNQDFDIQFLSESAGRYLRFKGGEPSSNLLRVINPDLLPDLRAALFSAQRDHKVAEFPNVRAVIEGVETTINLIVRRVEVDNETSDYLLIIFDENKNLVLEKDDEKKAARPLGKDEAQEVVVQRLEEELARTKENLRTTIEQHEISIEELKASNEELQAINEELRSTTEELETSKEELQSVNEELTTVNHELKEKMDETTRTNSDLQNLMASTDIATIFLDRNFRIKRFTPPVEQLFNITPLDIGRPLEHFTHKLEYQNLADDAAEVLRRLAPIEREVRNNQARTYLTRFAPYRTVDDRIEGVVLNFVDITERKRAEESVAADLKATQMLRDLSAQITTEGDIQVLYDKILNIAIALSQADAGTIQQYDEEKQELVLLSAKNFSPEMTTHFACVKAKSETSCGMALAKGERAYIDFDDPDANDPNGSLKMHMDAGYLSAQSTPLISRSGRVIGMFSTHWRKHYRLTERELRFLDLLARQAADLIEQRQAEKALRESEERFRLVMESVTDYAIITWGDNGAINSWSRGAEAIFDWTAAEVVGQSPDIIFTPEDRAAGVPQGEMRKAREEGRAEDERWHVRKDGPRFFASGVMTALRDSTREFVKITRDLTERKQLEEELRDSRDALEMRVKERTGELRQSNESLQSEVAERRLAEEQVKELLRRIVSTQEIERRRIARDLHDQLGQQLTALNLALESVKKETKNNAALATRIDQIQELARQIDSDVDFLTWELRPAELNELGLSAAVENFVQEWSKHFEIEAEFHAANLEKLRLSSEIEINLYRIAQEALNNIVKHAEASHASVLLERRNNSIVMVIEDNGKGFVFADSRNDRGIGLLSMRERASLVGGRLEIESAEGQGTSIFVRVPINPMPKE